MPRVSEELRPGWDRDFPGLLDWELDELERKCSNLKIDLDQLERGVVVVTFNWPFNGGLIPLKASFPASYPFLRPQVQLLTEKSTWPIRHVSPSDGNICLLGRDSIQWTSELTLTQLLDEKLDNALLSTGSEDPQGEPAEVWWNSTAPIPGSYILVDSAWEFGETTHGLLDVVVAIGNNHDLLPNTPKWPPPVRAVVMRVLTHDGTTLAAWNRKIPLDIADHSPRKITIRWHRIMETLIPSSNVGAQLGELERKLFGTVPAPIPLNGELGVQPFAFVHPIEVARGVTAPGWIVGGTWGAIRDLANKGKKSTGRRNPLVCGLLPVMRAGESDIGHRVPALGALKGKRIAVFGVGAVGAPVALELARNGCNELHLIDHDVVEPGNSVRWPLGASAWGWHKVAVLKHFINQQYPDTDVITHNHQLGLMNEISDEELLGQVLGDVALVVDGTASYGVNCLLWHKCTGLGIPLIRLSATPTVKGGTVVRHVAGGGCPVCLYEARSDGVIENPPGADDAENLTQPPGCGERTFIGADYDLQELSLQAVRLVVETLSSETTASSVVMTLSLVDAQGAAVPPRWTVEPLPKYVKCCGK